jgi:plastocyanin
MRLPTMFAWLAIGAVGVAGCGGGEAGGPKATTQPEGETATSRKAAPAGPGKPPRTGEVVQVAMRDIKMVPEKVTVKVGQTVKWTNEDPVAHTATARSGATFDSGTINAGKSYSWKASQAGTVEYYCTVHGQQQSGTITVTR